jgi:hypothetical protein
MMVEAIALRSYHRQPSPIMLVSGDDFHVNPHEIGNYVDFLLLFHLGEAG